MTISEYSFATGNITEREYTAEELEAISSQPIPTPPSPLDQIRALEAKYADDVAKITRQTTLQNAIELALTRPESITLTAGMSKEEAREAIVSVLLESDQGFRRLYELEQQVIPLRALIP